MLQRNGPERAFRAVVAGYSAGLEPTPAELAVLGEMVLKRSKFTRLVFDHFAQAGPPIVND